jgi:hypothetical protein
MPVLCTGACLSVFVEKEGKGGGRRKGRAGRRKKGREKERGGGRIG